MRNYTYSARIMRPRSNKTIKLNRKSLTVNGNIAGLLLLIAIGIAVTILQINGLINY